MIPCKFFSSQRYIPGFKQVLSNIELDHYPQPAHDHLRPAGATSSVHLSSALQETEDAISNQQSYRGWGFLYSARANCASEILLSDPVFYTRLRGYSLSFLYSEVEVKLANTRQKNCYDFYGIRNRPPTAEEVVYSTDAENLATDDEDQAKEQVPLLLEKEKITLEKEAAISSSWFVILIEEPLLGNISKYHCCTVPVRLYSTTVAIITAPWSSYIILYYWFLLEPILGRW